VIAVTLPFLVDRAAGCFGVERADHSEAESEIRMPKLETNPNKIKSSKPQKIRAANAPCLSHSRFEFVSSFGFRSSDFIRVVALAG
jgi:hypothetical protein